MRKNLGSGAKKDIVWLSVIPHFWNVEQLKAADGMENLLDVTVGQTVVDTGSVRNLVTSDCIQKSFPVDSPDWLLPSIPFQG